MNVYLPDGYNGTTTFPVFYLIHGGGDRYYTWANVGNAKSIIDNAISSGKAKPMIVIMPDVTDFAPDLFTRELLNDIIPYTAANFNTIEDKDHRALAGLSWGGLQVLDAGLYHYDMFGYLGVLSSGWFTSDTQKYATMKTYLNQNGTKIQQSIHYVYYSDGGQGDIAYPNGLATIKLLRDNGIKVNYFQNSGGHSYTSWSQDLQRILPVLFQDGNCTPTPIVSNIQLNGDDWIPVSSAQICSGSTIKFGPHPYDVTTGWSWKGPDNFSTDQREVVLTNVTTAKGGEYVVTFKNAGGCTSTAKVTLTVDAAPSIHILSPENNATISSSSVYITTDVSGTGIKKVTFWDGKYVIGEDSTSPYTLSWNNLASGNHILSATAINQNNCSDTAKVSLSTETITGLEEESASASTSAYPNPFVTSFLISNPGSFSYSIYDIAGAEIEQGSGNVQASAGLRLPTGLYLLKIRSNSDSKLIRITKE